MKSLLLASVVIATVTNVQIQTDAANVAPLQLVQTIPLPGVKGKFDHLAIDLAAHRIFIAAKINNTRWKLFTPRTDAGCEAAAAFTSGKEFFTCAMRNGR